MSKPLLKSDGNAAQSTWALIAGVLLEFFLNVLVSFLSLGLVTMGVLYFLTKDIKMSFAIGVLFGFILGAPVGSRMKIIRLRK
jgi:hypothetical protein